MKKNLCTTRFITALCALLLSIVVHTSGQAASWDPPIIINPKYDYQATTEFPEIDESQIEKVIYVDQNHSKANNWNPGTAKEPLKTISAAARRAVNSIMAGIPTKVKIASGLYREKLTYSFDLPKNASEKQRSTLLIIEGEPGKTIISGAIEEDTAAGINFTPKSWKPVKGAKFLYVNDWPYQIAPDPGPWINSYGFALLPRLLQRSEMIWVNGQRQRQLYSERYKWIDRDGVAKMLEPGPGRVDKSENNQPGKLIYDGLRISDPSTMTEPGTFAVYSAPETPEHLRGKIYLKLDRDISKLETIELGRWTKSWSPILTMRNRSNFLLRGLSFTKNASGFSCPALCLSNSKNFIIEDCVFNDNIGRGLAINESERGIIRRVAANENGSNGLGMGGSRQILFEDITTNFNNYRGAWEGFIGWDTSGFKSGGVNNITIRRHTAIGNYANGVWFDVYCKDVVIEDSFYLGNQRMGVMIEFTRPNGGPQVVRNNVVAFNRTGVFVTMAANSVVENNLVIENKEGHIEQAVLKAQLLYKFYKRTGGPMNAKDWESVRVNNNVFAAKSGPIMDYLRRKSNPYTEFPFILEVLESNDNLYWLPSQDKAFHSNDGSWLNLEDWRKLLKKYNAPGERDADSEWADEIPWEEDETVEFTSQASSGVSKLARKMGVPIHDHSIREYWNRVEAGLYKEPHLRFTKLYD